VRSMLFQASIAVVSVLGIVVAASAQTVGEPTGFDITIHQGAQLIAQKHVTVGLGGDLQDIKVNDGDPEDFVQLTTMTGSGDPTPIILKLVSGDDPMYRLISMYINVPLNQQDIWVPGPNSLFDPNGPDRISVAVTGMTFDNGAIALPQLADADWFYTSFMRDYSGHFYESPMTHPYNYAGHGIHDIQVPATAYLDGNASMYTFASAPGVASSWTWGQIPNPGLNTTVHDGSQSGQMPAQPGYVFELGLAVAFAAIPEPTTASLLLVGGLLVIRRRRSSR